MKKLIVLLLVLFTLFSVLSLTACQLDESSSENGESQQTADEASALKAEYDKIKAELEALNVLSDADKAKIAELEKALNALSDADKAKIAELEALKALSDSDKAKIAELEAALAALQKKYDEIAVKVKITFSVGEDASPIASQTVCKGATATEPAAPSREGFTFLGWYLDEEKFDFSTPITESITLTAKWEPQSAPPTPGIGGGGVESGWWDEIEYDSTTLRFKMTKNTNNEELPSGCERYMEGKGGTNTTIDQMVADRNADALYYTNIEEVIYTYYSDDTRYNFSKTFDVMYDEIYNPDLDSPDMYCNWMTDMLVASLRGCFANVYSHERGANYVDLTDPGYMSELMGSLTLNQEKIYVIASNYFIDLIRSFYVIPVNVDLYKSVVTGSLCADYDINGVLNIDDLFAQVKAGEWTYQKLIDYSAAVYAAKNTDTTTEELSDTLGFALGHDIISAQGLVYSSSVTIISKEKNEAGTGFNYGYAKENPDLYALASAIKGLVDANGIMCVTAREAQSVGVSGGAAALHSIRQQFTRGKMLFGGITVVGHLESAEYKEMKNNNGGGFGVVPVPVYKAGDAYNTAMHNTAKAGAISFYTTKFSQCTAFIHYQSSNSTDILNRYYDVNLTYGVADDLDGNIEMLQYIRSNVRTSFDKLFEDAIGFLYESQGNDLMTSGKRWHTIIANAYYMMTEMRGEYLALVGAKNATLDELVTQYCSTSN